MRYAQTKCCISRMEEVSIKLRKKERERESSIIGINCIVRMRGTESLYGETSLLMEREAITGNYREGKRRRERKCVGGRKAPGRSRRRVVDLCLICLQAERRHGSEDRYSRRMSRDVRADICQRGSYDRMSMAIRKDRCSGKCNALFSIYILRGELCK